MAVIVPLHSLKRPGESGGVVNARLSLDCYADFFGNNGIQPSRLESYSSCPSEGDTKHLPLEMLGIYGTETESA